MRVLLMDPFRQDGGALSRVLIESGHAVVGEVVEPGMLKQKTSALLPDAIVLNINSSDHLILEQLYWIQQNHPCPVVMFSYDGSNEKIQDAMRAGVTSYVVNGFSEWRINAILNVAVARFKEVQALRRELATAHGELAGWEHWMRRLGLAVEPSSHN